MMTKRSQLAIACILLSAAAGTADAFPGFARKYSPNSSLFTFMPCAGCHDAFPKLTPFGRRFKENGFRVDNDAFGWQDTLKAYPLALRTTSYTTGIGSSSSDVSTLGSIKPISAGALGSTFSYWIDQPFYVDEETFERGNLNHAWVGAYDLLRAEKPELLNVRGGAFELDLPFTQARTHNLFAYDPYFLASFDPEWSLAAPQRGVEVSGRPASFWRYSVAYVDSVRRDSERTEAFQGDLYLRFAVDVEGAHRFGGFFYAGEDVLELDSGESPVEHRRVGGDFDLRFASHGVSVYGLYLVGQDAGPGGEVTPHGGFVQAEKLLKPWLAVTSRFTQVTPGGDGETERNFAFGVQTWFFERLRVLFEYRIQDGGRSDQGALSFDFVL
jgi:hypothetical protein